MKIYFDGGLRKSMIAIVNDDNYVSVEKRKYNNEDYEWDALELAIVHAIALSDEIKEFELIGDNNQVIRWIQNVDPPCDSVIKQKCLEKLIELRRTSTVRGSWVKRNENLAGRVLEFHTRRSNKPIEFVATWYSCERCVFKSLVEKEKAEHFYNEHVTNG